MAIVKTIVPLKERRSKSGGRQTPGLDGAKAGETTEVGTVGTAPVIAKTLFTVQSSRHEHRNRVTGDTDRRSPPANRGADEDEEGSSSGPRGAGREKGGGSVRRREYSPLRPWHCNPASFFCDGRHGGR